MIYSDGVILIDYISTILLLLLLLLGIINAEECNQITILSDRLLIDVRSALEAQLHLRTEQIHLILKFMFNIISVDLETYCILIELYTPWYD